MEKQAVNKLTLEELSSAIAEDRILILPCKIGDPVYYEEMIVCKDCEHSEGKTYDEGLKDMWDDPIVDNCEEACPMVVKSIPFEAYMLDDDCKLSSHYKLNPEDVVIGE